MGAGELSTLAPPVTLRTVNGNFVAAPLWWQPACWALVAEPMWQSTYPHRHRQYHHKQYHHKHRATATPTTLEATGAVKAVAVVVVEDTAAEVVELAVVAQEAAQQAVVGLGTARVATHAAVAKVLVAVHVGLAVARAAGLAMAQAVDLVGPVAAARVGLVVVATVLVVPAVPLIVVPVTLARAALVALAVLMAPVLGPELVAVVAVVLAAVLAVVLAVVLAAVLAAFRVSTWKLQVTYFLAECKALGHFCAQENWIYGGIWYLVGMVGLYEYFWSWWSAASQATFFSPKKRFLSCSMMFAQAQLIRCRWWRLGLGRISGPVGRWLERLLGLAFAAVAMCSCLAMLSCCNIHRITRPKSPALQLLRGWEGAKFCQRYRLKGSL